MSFEIEQKFFIGDDGVFLQSLRGLGATEGRVEEHDDTYYNHPCRDFGETREALRVRRVDGIPMVTYKGPKLPGKIKARRELEWRLDPGDADGSKLEELLQLLGFRAVGRVHKKRHLFTMPDDLSDFAVVIDEVERLGRFAEVELIALNSGEIEASRDRITRLSGELGLVRGETRSYLTMILGLD